MKMRQSLIEAVASSQDSLEVEETRKDSLLKSLQRTQPRQNLDFGLLVSKNLRFHNSVMGRTVSSPSQKQYVEVLTLVSQNATYLETKPWKM